MSFFVQLGDMWLNLDLVKYIRVDMGVADIYFIGEKEDQYLEIRETDLQNLLLILREFVVRTSSQV